MSYWVIHKREPDEGEDVFHGEFFDTWIEAFVYSKVKQADRGVAAAVYEAYECERQGCEEVPQWGLEFCARCRNA